MNQASGEASGAMVLPLPLRLESEAVAKMDEAWRAKGIKNRMEFLRGAIGHYLAHIGAGEVAKKFAAE